MFQVYTFCIFFWLLGNGSPSQLDTCPVVVKQEAVDDIPCTNGYKHDKNQRSSTGSSPSSEEKEVKSPHDNSLHALPGRSSSQKMKRDYLNHASRLESTSCPENSSGTEGASRPEEISRLSPSLHGPESRLFQPDERIRNLHFEALKKRQHSTSPANDWSYPTKQVFKRFKPAPISVERSTDPAMSTQRFHTRRNEDFSPREQQQSFQYEKRETNHVTSLYGNEGVTQLVNGERSTAKSNGFHEKPRINGSLPDRPVKKVSSTVLPENNVSNSTADQKDEEPVWKTYQWYRDRKRPLSQQTKRQKTEQTIFMQYNEIRCKRVEEGRMVNERRRASEPCLDPIYSREKDHFSPSSPTKARSVESSHREGHLTSQSPHVQAPSRFLADHRVLPHMSSSPLTPIRHLKNGVQEYNFERRNSSESYFNGKAHFQCVCGKGVGTFAKEKTAQHVIFGHEKVKPRNQVHSANAEEKVGVELSANEDEAATEQDDGALERIRSPTEQAENIEVLPDKLRRYPQDVAKILRLNRIVKAVRNNKESSLPYSTTERQRTIMVSKRNPSHTTSIENDVFSDEMQIENPSDSDQELDQRSGNCNGHAADETIEEEDDDDDDDGQEEKEDERNSTRNLIDCFFLPERERQQIRNGRVNNPAFSQSISDKEAFSVKHLNGLGAVEARDDSDTVCQVNGLLSLPGFKETKFNISLGELKRRMNPPETLTRVEMISYVRQAKSSGRVLLDKNNIITANRSRPTILSRLCESEAQLLADGILKMNREYLPLTTLAGKTIEAYKDDDCQDKNCEDCRLKLRRRIVDVEITRWV